MLEFILGFLSGGSVLIIAITYFGKSAKQDIETELTKKNGTINSLLEKNLSLQKQMIEYKGAASSNDLRADALQKMKDDLQTEFDELNQYYDEIETDYKSMFKDYKKLFIELESLKPSELKNFSSPQEIINQMISEQTKNILLEVA